jgi:predicted nicotinamide N-methyase
VNVDVIKLDWRDLTDLATADVVIGSDLIWDEESAEASLACAKRIVDETGTLVFCFVARSPYLQSYVADALTRVFQDRTVEWTPCKAPLGASNKQQPSFIINIHPSID